MAVVVVQHVPEEGPYAIGAAPAPHRDRVFGRFAALVAALRVG